MLIYSDKTIASCATQLSEVTAATQMLCVAVNDNLSTDIQERLRFDISDSLTEIYNILHRAQQ